MRKFIVNGEMFNDEMEVATLIVDSSDLTEVYDDMLDETYGDIEICGYTYPASVALERIDPVAYRCGYNDYCNSFQQDIAYFIGGMQDGDIETYCDFEVKCIDEDEE